MGRPSTWTEDDLARARQMRDGGASYTAIAAALGRSRYSVTYWLDPEQRLSFIAAANRVRERNLRRRRLSAQQQEAA